MEVGLNTCDFDNIEELIILYFACQRGESIDIDGIASQYYYQIVDNMVKIWKTITLKSQ